MKQAVILAAGCGSRLHEASGGSPKCLVEVGGQRLLERQLQALRASGVDDICVVGGYQADSVEATVKSRCQFIRNDRYAETNSLYSLLLARDWIRGSFVYLNSDVLAHPEIYRRVLSRDESALAYDSTSGDDDEHMKVEVRDRKVLALGKKLEPHRVDGENVGIVQLAANAVDAFFREARELIQGGALKLWAPAALDCLARKIAVRAIDVAGVPWCEIDYPEDLAYARTELLPQIEGWIPAVA